VKTAARKSTQSARSAIVSPAAKIVMKMLCMTDFVPQSPRRLQR
jgi:hypothetical protein